MAVTSERSGWNNLRVTLTINGEVIPGMITDGQTVPVSALDFTKLPSEGTVVTVKKSGGESASLGKPSIDPKI